MKRIVENSIFVILITSVLSSLLITVFSNEFTVNYKFYIGMTAILLSFIVRLKSLKTSNIFFLIILILGLFNIIDFSCFLFETTLSIGSIETPTFNSWFLLLLCAFIIANRSTFNKLSGNTSETLKQEKAIREEESIQMYIRKYETKSVPEFEEIIRNKEKYVKHLVIAVQRLIDDKRKKK